MSVEHRSHDFRPQPERQGSRGLPIPHTEQTQPLQGRAEGRESLQGPTTVDRSSQGGSGSTHVQQPHPQSQERQSLPSMWNILEREVRLYDPSLPRVTGEKYSRKIDEISRLQEEMDEKGSPRDNLIRELYWDTVSINCPPGSSLFNFRHLTLNELQQFRSRIEPLSEEEIREEIHQVKEEGERQREEYRKRHKNDPPTTAHH